MVLYCILHYIIQKIQPHACGNFPSMNHSEKSLITPQKIRTQLDARLDSALLPVKPYSDTQLHSHIPRFTRNKFKFSRQQYDNIVFLKLSG